MSTLDLLSDPETLRPRGAPEARAAPSVSCFAIHAEAEPGVLPRVLQLFAKRSLVPERWHSDRVGPGGRELAIDLQVGGLTPELTDYLARCLRQLHSVETVLTSEKAAR